METIYNMMGFDNIFADKTMFNCVFNQSKYNLATTAKTTFENPIGSYENVGDISQIKEEIASVDNETCLENWGQALLKDIITEEE